MVFQQTIGVGFSDRCDVLVICSHNWDEDPNATVDRFEGHVGRVAQYVMDHCSIPLCIT